MRSRTTDPEIQEDVCRGPLERYTEHTITSGAALRAALAEVRTRGYAVARGTVNPLGGGVAVGIRGPSGEIVAALSITFGLDDSIETPEVVPALLTAARSISRGLIATSQ